jgi:hypothetical protein
MMHRIHWAAPAPTWIAAAAEANAADRAAAIRRPMLLRFASDAFMQELGAILDDDPERLAEIEARAGETWREYRGAPALPAADATLLATPVRRKLGARFMLTAQSQPKGAGIDLPLLKEGKKVSGETAAEPPVLKLFQSSHQRFYLVAASLVCRFPGLPDHFVDPARQERAWFVVRRLVPRNAEAKTFDPTQADEHAFVTGDAGSTWVSVPAPATAGAPPVLVRGEEKLPMFGSPYIGRDGVSRRLFTGLVPVSRREAYMGAPRGKPATPPMDEGDAEKMGAFPEPVDSRVVMLIDDVIGPWRALLAQVKKLNTETLPRAGTVEQRNEAAKAALRMRNQILQSSWLVLLDFAAYLHRYLPAVSAAVEAGKPDSLTTPAERALYTALTRVAYEASDRPKITLAEALKGFDTEAHRRTLEGGPTLLTDATRDQFKSLPRFAFAAIVWPTVATSPPVSLTFSENVAISGPDPDVFKAPAAMKAAVEAALKERKPDGSVPPPPATAQAAIPANRTTRFVLRCVFDRPHCGAVAPPILSEPTEPFVMAAFFDPDAPARQVRIAMPVDTSPAGLRRFQKGASFLISDVFCGQMGAARKLTLGDLVLSVLPWPFHKDLPEPEVEPCQDGMVCSLSIPIVTICALILLILIAIIFDIFFHWLPFLISCFPLKLRAKEQA